TGRADGDSFAATQEFATSGRIADNGSHLEAHVRALIRRRDRNGYAAHPKGSTAALYAQPDCGEIEPADAGGLLCWSDQNVAETRATVPILEEHIEPTHPIQGIYNRRETQAIALETPLDNLPQKVRDFLRFSKVPGQQIHARGA